MAFQTPRTWTTGELVTAAMLNQDVRDNIGSLNGSKYLGGPVLLGDSGDFVRIPGNVQTESVAAANTLYVRAIYVPHALTIATSTVRIASGTASSVVRLGIYEDDGFNYPGDLLAELGTVDASAGSTDRTLNHTNVALEPGTYWWATAWQVGTAGSWVAWGGVDDPPHVAIRVSGTTGLGTDGEYLGYQQSSVSGALPATFTTTPTPNAALSGPAAVIFEMA